MGGILAAGATSAEGGDESDDERAIARLADYGLHLGIAFQIRDDTLDLIGSEDELGKPVASDLAQGKVSLATLYAMRVSPRGARAVRRRQTRRRPPLMEGAR